MSSIIEGYILWQFGTLPSPLYPRGAILATNQIIIFDLKIRLRGGVKIADSEKHRFQCRASTSEEYASSSCLILQI
jgi:hypothetical protein